MASSSPRFLATGNINPSVVVKQDPAKDFHVEAVAAAKTDRPIGVSQEGTYYPPGVQGSDGYAAHDGQPITVYGEGEECLIFVGSAAVAAGDVLTFDVNGNAVTVAFTAGSGLIWGIGRALQAANPGEKVRLVVRILPFEGYTA